MGTGMTTPLWPPAKTVWLGTKENYDSDEMRGFDLTLSEVLKYKRQALSEGGSPLSVHHLSLTLYRSPLNEGE